MYKLENSVLKTGQTERESRCKGLVEAKSPTEARDVRGAHLYRFDGLSISLPIWEGKVRARMYMNHLEVRV